MFSEKFQNQCREQTNNKVLVKNKLGSQIIFQFDFNTIPYSRKVCLRITSL